MAKAKSREIDSRHRKILILGGDSYVGGHLIARLGPEKVTVTRYVSPFDNAKYFDALSMSLSEVIDAREEISHAVILYGDTNPETCAQDAQRSYRLNVESIKRVIDYLIRRNIKPVFASSEFVFDGEKGNYIESDPVNPLLIYSRQKVEIEKFLNDSCDNYIIVRFAKIFGSQPADRTLFSNWLEAIYKTDEIRCASDQVFSPVYVKNVVEAITLLIEKNCEGIFHISSRKPFARIELLKMLLGYVNNYVCKNIKVIPCSIHDFRLKEKRPLNVSMNPDKLIKATTLQISDVEEVCKTIVKNKFRPYE